MSDKDRKKKDGKDKNKDIKAMHEAVKERHDRLDADDPSKKESHTGKGDTRNISN